MLWEHPENQESRGGIQGIEESGQPSCYAIVQKLTFMCEKRIKYISLTATHKKREKDVYIE